MENRIQRFNCKKLPHVDKSVKEKFVRNAMMIVHWMASKLKDIDLFEDKVIGNPPYEAIDFRPKKRSDCVTPVRKVIDLTTVQSDILPAAVIEVSGFILQFHMEIGTTPYQ